MVMNDPIDHILRPQLPWRFDAGITECGLNAAKAPTLTRDQYVKRRKDYGQQRTAMTVCMTCASTAQRWESWEQDPRKAIGREVEWETHWSRSDRGDRLRDELLAVAALIESHRAEFEAHILAAKQRREWLAAKAQMVGHKAKPKPRTIGGL